MLMVMTKMVMIRMDIIILVLINKDGISMENGKIGVVRLEDRELVN